ncbi:MAG: hypothetical protein O3B87_03665 [bacterium]|nr:hypothetical protein [bacterium]
MNIDVNNFFLYFILPAVTIIFLITNRYYYSKKDTYKTRFNIPVDLFFGNFAGSLILLVILLGIYAYILNMSLITGIRWEIAAIFTIVLLTLVVGIGTGGHIVAVHIERILPHKYQTDEVQKVLDYYHWPFGHRLTYIPIFFIVHILILLDLFRGNILLLTLFQLMMLTTFAVISGVMAWIIFVITRTTRIMFYTLGVMVVSISFMLNAETVTLAEHQVAYFFTIVFMVSFALLIIYRYSHKVSESLHTFIHSKFDDGDKVRDE